MAVTAGHPNEKTDFFDVEQAWLALARRSELECEAEGERK